MELFINIILGNLDIFTIYKLYFGVMNKKTIYDIKDIGIGLLWGTINGILGNNIDGSSLKFLLYISIFFYIWNLYRNKLSEALIIDIIIMLLLAVVQVFILVIGQLCIQINILPFSLDDDYFALVSQILTAICVVFFCKLPLHKIYDVVQKDNWLKLFFYIAIVIVFIIFHRDFILIEMLKYTPFFIIILFGIFHTVKSISYYEVTKYSSVYHDMKNMFFGIYSATQGSNDLETLKEKLQGYYDVLGFDMTMAQINTENSVETIHSLIDFKLRESDKKIQIHRDILYYFDNLLVPISSVTYMIGVLIDYIISISDPEDSIKIYVCCGEYNLNIEVSYKYTKERNNVFGLINNKRLFSEEKLGHGLSNLKKMVKNYKGEFLARRKDMELMLVISIFN